MSSIRYSFSILVKLEFSGQIFFFEKYTNVKFHENPSSGSRVVPCGQTDGPDAADSRFSLFCEGPQKEVDIFTDLQ